jgi:hypothetical protein
MAWHAQDLGDGTTKAHVLEDDEVIMLQERLADFQLKMAKTTFGTPMPTMIHGGGAGTGAGQWPPPVRGWRWPWQKPEHATMSVMQV